MRLACCLAVLLPALAASTAAAQDSDKVLVIVNERSPRSRAIAEYYARKRSIPANQILRLKAPREGGHWEEPWYTAVGFPRIFYLKYHGYSHYFPLWALARYRNLMSGNASTTPYGI